MKTDKVIKNIPVKPPIHSTILYCFLLYYFEANGIAWGIFGTLYTIFWILVIIVIWNQERVDIFKEEETKHLKPTFKDRLEKLAKQSKD